MPSRNDIATGERCRSDACGTSSHGWGGRRGLSAFAHRSAALAAPSALVGTLAALSTPASAQALYPQSDGTAIAMALGSVNLPSEADFAMSDSVGHFDGTAAFGAGAVGRIADNWYVNGGTFATTPTRVGFAFAVEGGVWKMLGLRVEPIEQAADLGVTRDLRYAIPAPRAR